MSNPTVRISAASHKALRELAEQSGESMQSLLDKAVADYRRKKFLEGLAADYAALRSDSEAWADELAERKSWEATLMDGLDPDECWSEDGTVLPTMK